jgi:hypothetical protein
MHTVMLRSRRILDIKKTRQKLRSEISNVRYLVLVFLGAGINFSVGFGVVLSSLLALVQNPTQTLLSQAALPASVAILVFSYFIMGTIYATVVSLAFHPKRIISPLYIQIVTSAFVPILIVALQLLQPLTDLVETAFLALSYFAISFVMFFVAGIGQTAIVRYLVGLNGTKEDTSTFRLIILDKLENVLKVLRSDEVQEVLELDRREEQKVREHARLLRTSRTATKQFFIVVASDASDSNITHLATVSYSEMFYGVTKSGYLLENEREHVIKHALRRAKMKFTPDASDSTAQSIAYIHGLAVTESKLLSLRSLPPHTKAILGGLIVLAFIMTLVWKVGYVTSEMYESFLVFAALSVLFDLLPLLRTRRKSVDID